MKFPIGIATDYYRDLRVLVQKLWHDLQAELPYLASLIEQLELMRGDAFRGDAAPMHEVTMLLRRLRLRGQISQRVMEQLSDKVKTRAAKSVAEGLSRDLRKSLRRGLQGVDEELSIGIGRAMYGGVTAQGKNVLNMIEQAFVPENVSLIESIPRRFHDQVEHTIFSNIRSGRGMREIAKELRNVYGLTNSRAKLIARDQAGKLFGQLNRARQQDAGLETFIWRTVRDNRVREAHEALDGHVFSWETGADGLFPGDDYQCRCAAEPNPKEIRGEEVVLEPLAARPPPDVQTKAMSVKEAERALGELRVSQEKLSVERGLSPDNVEAAEDRVWMYAQAGSAGWVDSWLGRKGQTSGDLEPDELEKLYRKGEKINAHTINKHLREAHGAISPDALPGTLGYEAQELKDAVAKYSVPLQQELSTWRGFGSAEAREHVIERVKEGAVVEHGLMSMSLQKGIIAELGAPVRIIIPEGARAYIPEQLFAEAEVIMPSGTQLEYAGKDKDGYETLRVVPGMRAEALVAEGLLEEPEPRRFSDDIEASEQLEYIADLTTLQQDLLVEFGSRNPVEKREASEFLDRLDAYQREEGQARKEGTLSYTDVNSALRNPEAVSDSKVKYAERMAEDARRYAIILDEPIFAYRGVSEEQALAMQEGETVDKGFVSVTVSKSKVADLGKGIVEIELPKGAQVLLSPNRVSERELVLLPGSQFTPRAETADREVQASVRLGLESLRATGSEKAQAAKAADWVDIKRAKPKALSGVKFSSAHDISPEKLRHVHSARRNAGYGIELPPDKVQKIAERRNMWEHIELANENHLSELAAEVFDNDAILYRTQLREVVHTINVDPKEPLGTWDRRGTITMSVNPEPYESVASSWKALSAEAQGKVGELVEGGISEEEAKELVVARPWLAIPEERYNEDEIREHALRHEVGHAVLDGIYRKAWTWEDTFKTDAVYIPDQVKGELRTIFDKMSRSPDGVMDYRDNELLTRLGGYASEEWFSQFWPLSTTTEPEPEHEPFAEAFALYTAPYYKKGMLPDDLEAFLGQVTGALKRQGGEAEAEREAEELVGATALRAAEAEMPTLPDLPAGFAAQEEQVEDYLERGVE